MANRNHYICCYRTRSIGSLPLPRAFPPVDDDEGPPLVLEVPVPHHLQHVERLDEAAEAAQAGARAATARPVGAVDDAHRQLVVVLGKYVNI